MVESLQGVDVETPLTTENGLKRSATKIMDIDGEKSLTSKKEKN